MNIGDRWGLLHRSVDEGSQTSYSWLQTDDGRIVYTRAPNEGEARSRFLSYWGGNGMADFASRSSIDVSEMGEHVIIVNVENVRSDEPWAEINSDLQVRRYHNTGCM